MVSIDFTIVGAGPGGVSAALALASKGYKIKIMEALPQLAVKPCGWGIPKPETLPFKVPEESILSYVDGARLFVDGKHVLDHTGKNLGIIVDKQLMLKELIESTDNVHIAYKSPVSIRNGLPPLLNPDKTIIATGVSAYKGEKINAVQLELETSYSWDGLFEFNFNSELIGYYWVFPISRHRVKVGVGGFGKIPDLKNRLFNFIRKDERLKDSRIVSRLEGAQLAVGGILLSDNPPYYVGEAAGSVYPLTGEGIRPSIITGKALGDALAEGRNPIDVVKKTDVVWKISLQRRILEGVKKLSPKKRAEFLSNLNPEVLIRVGLGDFNRSTLLKFALTSPKGLASILSTFARR